MKRTASFFFLLLGLAVSGWQTASAQLFGKGPNRLPAAYAGLGFGLDHGGLGAKVELYPVKPLSLFGGIGYNIAGYGLNAGLSFKMLPDRKATPVLSGMWGYNAVLTYPGSDRRPQVFYGFTLGAGAEVFVGKNRNKLDFGLWYPIRDAAFREQASLSLPIAVSFGFGFAIK